jgi:hypothetical protein
MRQLFIIFLLVFSFSCQKKEVSYKKIIPEIQMRELIIDLHLADGVINSYINHKNPIFVRKAFYDSLFSKHKVTERQFLWNLIHYSEQKKICEIYEKAISELTARKATFEQKLLRENKMKN